VTLAKTNKVFVKQLFFFALFSLSVLVRAEDKLNLFIWSEYLPPTVVSEFEKRFHCKIVIDVYEDAENMLAKIQGGGASLYDIVVPPDYIVPALAKQNLISPLHKESLPNLKNVDPKFLNPPFDPENRFTVPYQWGTVGIYVRKPEGKSIEESWALFFDPKKQPGEILLMDTARDLIGAALKYKGRSFNSTDPKQLLEARDLLIDAKKRASGFAGSVGGKNKILDKSVKAAIVYSGEAARGMSEDAGTYYFIPREGSQIWVDNLVILANAPHRELAQRFLNFALEPKIGAEISNFTQFSTPNAAARKLIKPELLNNPAIYPPPETMEKLEFLKDLGKDSRLYDQIWTQIKSK
jgi:spermidine/putrescine transport system substrate-binding protein